MPAKPRPSLHAVRCIGCGAWTDNHWACAACDEAVHNQFCPWRVRKWPSCICTAGESQILAYGYYTGRLAAYEVVDE